MTSSDSCSATATGLLSFVTLLCVGHRRKTGYRIKRQKGKFDHFFFFIEKNWGFPPNFGFSRGHAIRLE